MLTVVVVEDHAILRETLVAHLTTLGYRAFSASQAEALQQGLGGVRPDIYLLDLNLPGEDGLSLARRLRAAEPNLGIVMVTARGALSDRLIGYESGADAYLTKPIVLDELDAVLAAVARRVRPSMVAEFVLDTAAERLTGPEGSVALSWSQVAMLDALAVAPERSLPSAQLVQALGHAPETYRKASLEVHVARVRERLAQVGAKRGGIVAVRGMGYRLTIDLKVRRIPSR
ncbi:MAG: DNA-binding response regulator [Phycisphaerales bacterium]|nr:MAG: DNA-binding response regulator [Phycisphaerales bacterium]